MTESTVGDDMSTCPFCTKLFKSRGLMKHMKSAHRDGLLAELYGSKGKPEDEQESVESIDSESDEGPEQSKMHDEGNEPDIGDEEEELMDVEEEVVDMEVDANCGEKEMSSIDTAEMDVDSNTPSNVQVQVREDIPVTSISMNVGKPTFQVFYIKIENYDFNHLCFSVLNAAVTILKLLQPYLATGDFAKDKREAQWNDDFQQRYQYFLR